MVRSLTLPFSVVATVLIGIAAPLQISPSAEITPATAECPTCCPQQGATCVVCGTISCSAFPASYDAPVGSPCQNES